MILTTTECISGIQVDTLGLVQGTGARAGTDDGESDALACQLEGRNVLTIEGLEENGELSAIQRIFTEEIAIQCGYCTAGMIMSAKALLMHNPHPTEAEIRNALAGNICRCSGYTQIIRAVKRTAAEGGC